MGQQIETRSSLATQVYHNLLMVQEQDHQQLKAMAKESETEWTPSLTKLVEQVIRHYENYYRVESELIMENVRVLLVLSPEWPPHLEDAFLWVGGWRPSVTFHLLDFKPGSELGAGLGELLEGLSLCEFKDITPSQLARVSELMRRTIREETELTQSLLDSGRDHDEATPVDQIFALAEIFGKAYDLRVRTLKSLVQILSPIQAAQFFGPIGELHLKVQEWSKNKENATRGVGRDGGPEPFSEFFERRILEQEHDLEELRLAAIESTHHLHDESTQPNAELTRCQRQLVDRVMCHYKNYYRVKSKSVRQNVLTMLTASWMTPLEHAFLWIGGWRPTTAFHLLFSIVGLQLEARLEELLSGELTSEDLGNLSPSQLIRVDELQTQTVKEERGLTEALAALQETLADSSMVELSHIATESTRAGSESTRAGSESTRAGSESTAKERVKTNLGIKEEKLKEVFWKADNLRLKTLKNVVNILSPIQAVHFLIGAAELHLRLHDWGA